MRHHIHISLFSLFLLLATCPAAAVAGKNTANTPAKPGSSPQQPLSVSLIQLIANPDAFDGKHVRILGFVRIEHEGSAIYLHREDFENSLTRNGLWLAASDIAAEGTPEAKVNNRYALIEGRFNAKMHGHLGLWSGSIEDITRMQVLEIRKDKK